MKTLTAVLLTLAFSFGLASGVRAQGGGAAPESTAVSTPELPVTRASWVSDRLPLGVGSILTVVVDEQTAARERVSQIATGNRGQRAKLNLDVNSDVQAATFGTGVDSDSRDVGEANRQGDLVAVLTVRVTAIEPGGVARIEGAKTVTVDGRRQEISLQGAIRPQDVSPSNLVLSSRVAEAVITYKGKKIGPRTGIVGKILSLLWP